MELFDDEIWINGESRKVENMAQYYYKKYCPQAISFSICIFFFPENMNMKFFPTPY